MRKAMEIPGALRVQVTVGANKQDKASKSKLCTNILEDRKMSSEHDLMNYLLC